jgi:hypothetical protein
MLDIRQRVSAGICPCFVNATGRESMDTIAFDRISRVFARTETRRSALGMLLGTTLLGTPLGAAAATGRKHRHKRKRRGKTSGKDEGRERAQAKSKPGNHCLTPSGLDLNAFLGISEQIVTSYCREVGSGEEWTTSGPWFVNGSFATVPEGFLPAGETPVEDFQAKFTALKLLIDPGSPQERTVVFPNTGNVFAGPANAIAPGAPEEVLILIPASLGTVQPLPVGDHIVHAYWIFSAMHCDGLGTDTTPVSGNCFPAGETLLLQLPFEVVPGHQR